MALAQQVGLGALFLAFLGGLVSFFSPCVCPLIPAYLSYLSGVTRPAGAALSPSSRATSDTAGGAVAQMQTAAHTSVSASALASAHASAESRAIALTSILFVGGFSLAFVALGMLIASFGVLFAAYKLVIETVVGGIMLLMGMFLLGFVPRSWSAVLLRERRFYLPTTVVQRLGPVAPFALGGLFALGWTPCIGPILAAILGYVGAAGTIAGGALLLAVYSLGFAIPFLALGIGWSAGLRNFRWMARHGRAIELASGVALVLVGLLYVSGQASTFAIWAQHFVIHV